MSLCFLVLLITADRAGTQIRPGQWCATFGRHGIFFFYVSLVAVLTLHSPYLRIALLGSITTLMIRMLLITILLRHVQSGKYSNFDDSNATAHSFYCGMFKQFDGRNCG